MTSEALLSALALAGGEGETGARGEILDLLQRKDVKNEIKVRKKCPERLSMAIQGQLRIVREPGIRTRFSASGKDAPSRHLEGCGGRRDLGLGRRRHFRSEESSTAEDDRGHRRRLLQGVLRGLRQRVKLFRL